MEKINLFNEKYEFNWVGKSLAKYLSKLPIKFNIIEDKNWNNKLENKNSGNILIKGDNLIALKYLQTIYENKIKMIYIDPPYNTRKKFIYNDKHFLNTTYLSKLLNIDESELNRFIKKFNKKEYRHSAWLTFMYPRLYIARKLLKEDGVIFISIDNNEIAQLKLLMDEIFGEENFVEQITVINNLKGRSDDNFFATCNDYLLVYSKNINKLEIRGFKLTNEEIDNEYKYEDEYGVYKLTGFRKTGKGWEREHRPFMYYPILEKNGKFYAITEDEYGKIFDRKKKVFNDKYVEELIEKYEKLGFNVYLPLNSNGKKGRWRWGFKEFKNRIDNITLNNNGTPCVKERPYLEDGTIREKLSKTVWYKGEYDTGSAGKYLKRLFNTDSDVFENPKSVEFIKDILRISTEKNDIILDFFAGSGTTGEAVMQLNVEDGGNRKFILVQLDEPIDPKKNKTAYDFVKNELGIENPTIFDICKERLVWVAKKVKEEIIDKKIEEKEKEINELKQKLQIDEIIEKIKKLEREIESLKNQDLGFKIYEI